MTVALGLSQKQLTVKWAGCGSLWWRRPGATLADSALMNTSGFIHGSREVRCWCTPETSGFVRINCNRSRPIARYEDEVGGVYLSDGVVRAGAENRLLLHPRVSDRLPVDCFLVALNHEIHGSIRQRSGAFSGRLQIVSVSERKRAQQLLVLMWPGSTVTTTLGRLELSWILEYQKLPSR
jgi:hypothetical protein